MRSTEFLCVRVCAREMANSTGFKTLKKHLCKIRRMRLKYYIEKEESEKISSSSSSNNIQQLSFTLSFYWNYYVSSKIVIRDYGFNWKFCRVGKTMKNSLEFKMRMEKKLQLKDVHLQQQHQQQHQWKNESAPSSYSSELHVLLNFQSENRNDTGNMQIYIAKQYKWHTWNSH